MIELMMLFGCWFRSSPFQVNSQSDLLLRGGDTVVPPPWRLTGIHRLLHGSGCLVSFKKNVDLNAENKNHVKREARAGWCSTQICFWTCKFSVVRNPCFLFLRLFQGSWVYFHWDAAGGSGVPWKCSWAWTTPDYLEGEEERERQFCKRNRSPQ